MRVRDIALEAHVGTSSVMRLIHKMGYDSYTDFKEYIIDKKELEVYFENNLSMKKCAEKYYEFFKKCLK